MRMGVRGSWELGERARGNVLGKLVPVDELVVLVCSAGRLVLHLLGEVFEETAPFGRRAKLGHEVRRHPDALVREEHDASSGYVVHVVEVVRRCDRGKVSLGLDGHCNSATLSARTRMSPRTVLRFQILMTFLSALSTYPSPAIRLPPSIQVTFFTGRPYP